MPQPIDLETGCQEISPFLLSKPLSRIVNYSLEIQRDIGFSTVIDISCTGTQGRHLFYVKDINAIPMYARFDPANNDSTTSRPLPDNFLRPCLDFGNLNLQRFDAAGKRVNANFGAFTGARDPRRIQMSLRVMFYAARITGARLQGAGLRRGNRN